MAIVTRQVTATAAGSTLLGTIPNGECSVVISNAGNTAILVGPGANLTQSNGIPVNSGSNLTFQTYAASKGADIYVQVASGGSSTAVGMLISTTD